MPVVGGTNEHGIDIFALQDFAEITGGENLIAPFFFGAYQPVIVQITDCRQFDAGYF